MLIKRNVVLSIALVSCAMLPTSARQEKPEDCIKGKQYWSTSLLNPKGTCAPCPHHWKSCDDQPIGDDKRCKDSCRGVKSITSTPVLSSKPEQSKVLPKASIPSAVHSAKPREYQNSSSFDINTWIVILIALISLLVILLLAALVVALVRTPPPAGNRDETSKNPEEGIALQTFQQNDTEARFHEPDDTAERFHEQDDEEDRSQANNGEDHSQPNDGLSVQATPSSTRIIQGIQEDKDKGLSSLDLDEIHT